MIQIMKRCDYEPWKHCIVICSQFPLSRKLRAGQTPVEKFTFWLLSINATFFSQRQLVGQNTVDIIRTPAYYPIVTSVLLHEVDSALKCNLLERDTLNSVCRFSDESIKFRFVLFSFLQALVVMNGLKTWISDFISNFRLRSITW